MINPTQLDDAFKEFSQNLNKWVPDGVILVNLGILHELGLLTQSQFEQAQADNITHYFHVIETPDKVTLFNQQFAIWIVPKLVDDYPTTLTYLSLLHQEKPHLELVFSTAGVYNTPKYILKVLQHFISEVLDTEAIISAMGKKS